MSCKKNIYKYLNAKFKYVRSKMPRDIPTRVGHICHSNHINYSPMHKADTLHIQQNMAKQRWPIPQPVDIARINQAFGEIVYLAQFNAQPASRVAKPRVPTPFSTGNTRSTKQFKRKDGARLLFTQLPQFVRNDSKK